VQQHISSCHMSSIWLIQVSLTADSLTVCWLKSAVLKGNWLAGVNVPFRHKYGYIRDERKGS